MANIEIDKRNTEFTPSGGAEVPQTVGSREPSGANVWAKFPQVRARLTARDQAVLAPGFQVVLCGYASMRMGSLPNSAYFRAYPELRLRDAEYDPELLARIFLLSRREATALHEPGSAAHRIQLDAFEAAFLAFCARLTARQLRHRHIHPSQLVNLRTARRVAEKFEHLRKIAKAAWLRSKHSALYRQYQERWRRFSRWLHTYFGCRCQRQPRHLIRQFRRLVVANVMAMCRQVIRENQLIEPNDRTVRDLARIFLRKVRRRRIRGVGLRDAIRKTPLCLRRLEFFLERRLPKMISKST